MYTVATLFRPKPSLTEAEVQRGLRMTVWQGVTATAMFSVTTSGLLAAFALALGANNLQIGILAAIPFIMQPVQIPAILLVERLRRRKLIALAAWFPGQAIWLLIALIPVFVGAPSGAAVSALLGLMAIRGALGAITGCSWNSWLRDLVPQQALGRFFSRRQALSTVASIVFGLGSAAVVDLWRARAQGGEEVLGYTLVLLLGAIFLGLTSPIFMALVPEPLMTTGAGPQPSLRKTLATPLGDGNFRHLMKFLFLWGFASNLAVPFFTVYMLERLGLPLSAVIGFSVLAQLFNVVFLNVWGPLADRFGSKVVLSLSASLYLIVILGWTFTTMPERYFLTIPLLVLLHIFAGIAGAGVGLTVETIGLKLAPQGQSTAYLAGASLATSLGAALGPLVGGRFADFFSVRQLSISFSWIDPSRTIQFSAVHLTGFDFLFALAFVVGLLTLNSLTALKEQGEATRQEVLEALTAHTRELSRSVMGIPGLSFIAQFPYSRLRSVSLVPGLDVAIGVTAYELASTTKTAVVAASRGGAAAADIASRVSHALAQAMERVEHRMLQGVREMEERYAAEVARHATRGVLHAFDDMAVDIGHLARGAVLGVAAVLGKGHADPRHTLRGIGYGAVQGAGEAGASLAEATTHALESAREAARRLDMDERDAQACLAQGALEAAASLGPEAVAEVRKALPLTPGASIQGPARQEVDG